jgi:hypothetical protein
MNWKACGSGCRILWGTILEGLRKTMRSVSQGQNLNLGPQGYERLTSTFSRTRSFRTRYPAVHRLAKALQMQIKKSDVLTRKNVRCFLFPTASLARKTPRHHETRCPLAAAVPLREKRNYCSRRYGCVPNGTNRHYRRMFTYENCTH